MQGAGQIEFGDDGIMKWQRVQPPLWWPAAKAHVIADRHLPDGTRQHILDIDVPAGATLCNAQIFGPGAAQRAEFSSPSRLIAISRAA